MRFGYREWHFLIFLVIVLAFSLGAAFFFAPFILTVSYGYVLGLMAVIAAIYGYFTGVFVYDLDHVTHNHHAGVWVTAVVGSALGYFLLRNRLVGSAMQGMVPGGDALQLLGLFFATAYCVAYTLTVLIHESRDPVSGSL